MKQSKNLTTGTMGTAVYDHLKTAYNVVAQPRLIADWNYNRYADKAYAQNDVWPEEIYGFDVVNFPITSIIEPLRASKGVLKARAGESLVSSEYTAAKDPKFYIGDPDDNYKYWTSMFPTDGSGNFPTAAPYGSVVQPYVLYDGPVMANKIVIRIDNTWATPKDYVVQLCTGVNAVVPTPTDGTNPIVPAGWTTIGGSNPTMDLVTGLLTLYYNGTAWVTTKPATLVTTSVQGIKFKVDSMKQGYTRNPPTTTPVTTKKDAKYTSAYKNSPSTITSSTSGANSSLSLIAIEAHMEVDLSDRLIATDDEFDLSEPSQLYPIGTITANQGSLTLDNTDGIFDYENVSSPYYRLLDKNVEMNLEYIYDISGTLHSVQEFIMYTEGWGVDGEGGTVGVELLDYSKYLRDIKPSAMMYENKSVTQLVWRVLDSVGFVDYEIQTEDTTIDHIIPVFWTTGEQTVWEVLNDLAEATQTAIYFDSYGKLQVRTREAAFNTASTPAWNLRAVDQGSFLADIITLDQNQEFEANKVTVTYKTTTWKVGTDGLPAMSVVWEPEGDLVVRSSPLQQGFGISDNVMNLGMAEVAYWPFESVVQIDGELLKYRGKHFIYYTGTDGNTVNQAWVGDYDEWKRTNELTLPEFRYKNSFSGYVLITQRGIWGTVAVDHPNTAQGWRTKMITNDQTSPTTYTNVTNFYQNPSSVAIVSHPYMNGPNDLYFATRGVPTNTGYKVQGTRLFFASGFATNRAGFAFRQSGVEEDGYYVEIRPTSTITNRAVHNEITLFSRVGRQWKVLHAGVPYPIAEWIWYDVDATVETSGGTDTISVWLNGLLVAKGTATGSWKQPNSEKSSMYARGKTAVGYEYMYGINDGAITPDSGYGFFDLKYGGVRGGSWEQTQVWQIGYRWGRLPKFDVPGHRIGKVPYQKNLYYFDEFGPYVHEVREFDVKMDPAPVQYSQLYSTNEWLARTVEYYASPFKSHFTIANIGRTHAILNGSDALTYGGGNGTIEQMCVVLGRDLTIAEDETVVAKDDAGIRRRGLIETELASDWLQSKAMAQAIADWIVSHWGKGVDELTLEIFGNPLIELGDVVTVHYPEKSMSATTHKYFVTGVKNDFDNGVGTNLTLRRVPGTKAIERLPH